MRVDIISNNNAVIETKDMGRLCQSYDKIIALDTGDEIILDKRYWNFSKTTSKHRSAFLRESTKETQRKIDNGTYKLEDLNK